MWAAIALSFGLFGALLASGRGDDGASLAGGALLLACVAVCVWAAAQGKKAEREVDRAVEQVAQWRRTNPPERS